MICRLWITWISVLTLVFLYEPAVASQPNIIFILADDLGYGELGCYGGKDIETPNLDQLASQGVRFTRAYANSTVCSPSRASILFGTYPDRLGVPGVIRDVAINTWGNLTEGIQSMPDQLNQKGYDTGLIGKWHLGYESPDLPNDRGFDYFKGFLGDMMDDYFTHLRHGVNWMRENDQVISTEGHATDLFTDWAVDYVRDRRETSKPFFLFLAYNAPHDPVQPPIEYLDQVKLKYPDLSEKRQKIVALIEHLDDNIGRLLTFLEEESLSEETLIIFTSDNGGALRHGARNDPWNGGKGDMLEGGLRVPCIVSWKNHLSPQLREEPILLMNFYHALSSIHEEKFMEYLTPPRQENMVWVRREGHRFGGRAYYAISDGRYKLLQNDPFEPYQLFDLDQDSLETHPIDQPDIRQELMKRLTRHIQLSGSVPWH